MNRGPGNYDLATRQMEHDAAERAVLDARELSLVCQECGTPNHPSRIVVHLRRDWTAFCSHCTTIFPVKEK